MNQDLIVTKLKARALRLLARRDHSRHELKSKLTEREEVSSEQLAKIFQELDRMGYLPDEENLAHRLVIQLRNEGRGRQWIIGKLKKKGLPIPEILDDEEELEAARIFLTKKLRGRKIKELSYEERGRYTRSLVSRGFSFSVVATLLKKG